MAVRFPAKTVRQEVVYGACWVGGGVVGYCVERQVLTRVGLGVASQTVGITSVVVVVAVCIMDAEVFVIDGPKGYLRVCKNAGHRVVAVGRIFGSGCLDG